MQVTVSNRVATVVTKPFLGVLGLVKIAGIF